MCICVLSRSRGVPYGWRMAVCRGLFQQCYCPGMALSIMLPRAGEKKSLFLQPDTPPNSSAPSFRAEKEWWTTSGFLFKLHKTRKVIQQSESDGNAPFLLSESWKQWPFCLQTPFFFIQKTISPSFCFFKSAGNESLNPDCGFSFNNFTRFKLTPVSNILPRFPGWTKCFLEMVYNGVGDVFSCLVGVSKMSAQSAATCI